jgi:hypothetical protein
LPIVVPIKKAAAISPKDIVVASAKKLVTVRLVSGPAQNKKRRQSPKKEIDAFVIVSNAS